MERTLLSARLLNLLRGTNPHQSVVGFKLLHRLVRVVDQGESGALAAAVLCPESEDVDLVFVGFVEFGEFAAEFVFGDVGAVGVEDVTVAGGLESVSGELGCLSMGLENPI